MRTQKSSAPLDLTIPDLKEGRFISGFTLVSSRCHYRPAAFDIDAGPAKSEETGRVHCLSGKSATMGHNFFDLHAG